MAPADRCFVPAQHGLDERGACGERGVVQHRSAFLVALLTALWLAMWLLGGPFSAADRGLLPLFHASALVAEALVVTRLGNAYILLPLSLAALIVIALRRGRRSALLYLVLVLSGRALVEAQKDLIGRLRPDPAGRLDAVTSFSFPSAHAANSMVAWLGFALIVAPPRYRPAAVAAALALAMLVGLTRLVLAVHWPSDVIGGWAFGAAWTLLLLRLVQGTSPPLRH
ncbi:MAG TPA: phosphatase PAP2 family protein [Allosphingosinicella sp.]|jgi:undecaprenyl-diphosphatase|nr:phosphatase PAP2 family protein [Allosphingosinicella sp.]